MPQFVLVGLGVSRRSPFRGLLCAGANAIIMAFRPERLIMPVVWPSVEVGYIASFLAHAHLHVGPCMLRGCLRPQYLRLQFLHLLLKSFDDLPHFFQLWPRRRMRRHLRLLDCVVFACCIA